MPGNLEAPLILANARADVEEETLIPQGCCANRAAKEEPPPSRCQGRRRRRSEPLTPALLSGS
jgi:hypothetical protein